MTKYHRIQYDKEQTYLFHSCHMAFRFASDQIFCQRHIGCHVTTLPPSIPIHELVVLHFDAEISNRHLADVDCDVIVCVHIYICIVHGCIYININKNRHDVYIYNYMMYIESYVY